MESYLSFRASGFIPDNWVGLSPAGSSNPRQGRGSVRCRGVEKWDRDDHGHGDGLVAEEGRREFPTGESGFGLLVEDGIQALLHADLADLPVAPNHREPGPSRLRPGSPDFLKGPVWVSS